MYTDPSWCKTVFGSPPAPASLRILLTCWLPLLLTSHLLSQGKTRYVPSSYSSIQSAIDAAYVGDTVLVDRGLFYENLRIRKNVVLASRFILDGDTSHISRTIIDGSRFKDPARASTILIAGATDTSTGIIGLTVRGGRGTLQYMKPAQETALMGGGILVRSMGCRILHNIIVQNAVVSDSLFGFGGGIAGMPREWESKGERIIIENNIISSNEVRATYVNGGGISLHASGVVRRNVIVGNTAEPSVSWGVGGGISFGSFERDTAIIERNRVLKNVCRRAGGIGCYGQSGNTLTAFAYIANNVVTDNDGSERGGGIAVWQQAEGHIVNNTVLRNSAGLRGSGLDIADAVGYLINNVVYGNRPDPQVFTTSLLQSYHNVIPDGLFGDHNSSDDPLLPTGVNPIDPKSPLLASAAPSIYIHGRLIKAPSTDIDGRPRSARPTDPPDVGATEYEVTPALNREDTHVLKLCVRISADTNRLGDDHIFTLERRSTRVEFGISDTMWLGPEKWRDGIELPSYDAPLMIEFTHVREIDDPVIHVTYALEGRDTHDHTAGPNTLAGYTRLAPGEYTLKVRSEHSQFVRIGWADDRLRIFVPNPWWETPVFRVSVGSLAFALFAFVYKREVRRHRKEQMIKEEFTRRQMDSQESERKRLAAELHDGLGQNLLLAGNELRQYLRAPDGSHDGIRQAANLIQESIHSVREMASNLHPHQLERLGFCAALKAMVEVVSHATGLKVECRCDDVDRLVSKETAIQLFRIIQEALTNIVRHAKAGEASIEINRHEKEIRIIVSDNGRGFKIEKVRRLAGADSASGDLRGFGLSSMIERARIAGAEFVLDSSPNQGTRVKVTVPILART